MFYILKTKNPYIIQKIIKILYAEEWTSQDLAYDSSSYTICIKQDGENTLRFWDLIDGDPHIKYKELSLKEYLKMLNTLYNISIHP